MSRRMSELRREIDELKREAGLSHTGGFTKKEKARYTKDPVAFAREQIYFKGKLVRLSDDQSDWLQKLGTFDPQYAMDTYANESPEIQDYQFSATVASRNGGKTFIFAIYALWRAIFFDNLWIRELGGSMKQAKIFYHQYFKKFIEANEKIFIEVKGKVQSERTEFKSGSVVETGACSETSVRGPHPDILLLDEVAAADKAKKTAIIEAALDSALGQIVMASTAHHVSGLFIRYLLKAEEFGYKIFKWPACDLDPITKEIIRVRAPWIPKWRIEHAMATKDWNTFSVEWLADVASTASMVFGITLVDKAIIPIDKFVELSTADDNEAVALEERIKDLPKPMQRYYLEDDDLDIDDDSGAFGGCDIGYVHPTAIVILKKDLDDCFWAVHFEHYRGRSANWRARRIAELQEEYGIDQFCIDAEDISFAHMCIEAGAVVKAIPFQTYKVALIGTLRSLFEKGLIKIPDTYTVLIDQLKEYAYDSNGKPVKGNDDAVDALLFAVFFWSANTNIQGFEAVDFNPW